ncbi:MAG: hypothetical protein ACXV8P_11110 [Methylobacter sp.]
MMNCFVWPAGLKQVGMPAGDTEGFQGIANGKIIQKKYGGLGA